MEIPHQIWAPIVEQFENVNKTNAGAGRQSAYNNTGSGQFQMAHHGTIFDQK